MANEQSQNGREEYWIDEITYAKGGLLLQSRILNSETYTLNKSDLDFDKQLCYCTCLHEMLEVNYLKEKCNKRSAAPLMPTIVFCILLWVS